MLVVKRGNYFRVAIPDFKLISFCYYSYVINISTQNDVICEIGAGTWIYVVTISFISNCLSNINGSPYRFHNAYL